MRIPLRCIECSIEEMNAEFEADEAARGRGETPPKRPPRPMRPEDWYLADIEQDNAYVGPCRNSHEMRVTLQVVRYQLLFESGIVAELVGFHREAVSSIAAALERFYEFAIEVFTLRAGIEPDTHAAAWEQVHQSERQLGAFLFLHLVNLGKAFKVGRKEIETYEKRFGFRNKVIHAGYFPSEKEVLDFARYVYDLIVETRKTLVNLDAAAVEKVELRHYAAGHAAVLEKAGGQLKVGKDGLYRSASGPSLPMMLNTMTQGDPEDFDSRLAASRKNLWLWGLPAARLVSSS
jgi:hypothetical protein